MVKTLTLLFIIFYFSYYSIDIERNRTIYSLPFYPMLHTGGTEYPIYIQYNVEKKIWQVKWD